MITPSFSPTATERVLPKLALDFTTASLDARITFTRTTDATHPATYVNSSGYVTAATNNQARFDYDPVTLACKGLLIEESRSNLTIYSQDFSNGAWTLGNVTIGSSTTSPDGTSDGQSLMETVTNAGHRYFKTASIVAVAGTTYTYTVFCKSNGRSYVRLADTAVANVTCFFDITNGTVGTVGSAVTASSITNYGNGWFRCSISYVMVGTSATPALNISTDGTTVSYAGDVTKGVYAWGAQVEAGAFATSYIPTTSAALTRNADVATMTGTNFSSWYNATQGAIVVSGSARGTGAYLYSFAGSDNSGNNSLYTYVSTTYKTQAWNTAALQANIDSSVADGASIKVSVGYAANNFGTAANGNATQTDLSYSQPSLDKLRIGNQPSGGAVVGQMYIQKINYYPQRLTNAELQAFSK